MIKETPCLTYALWYLYHAPKTKKELRARLVMKKFPLEDIEQAITFLEQKKYLDDENFARMYFQSEVGRKGKSFAIVKKKLEQRWVDKKIIEKVWLTMQKELEESILQRIKKDVEKYKKKNLSDFDIKVKLHQKWYSISQIKQAISQIHQKDE